MALVLPLARPEFDVFARWTHVVSYSLQLGVLCSSLVGMRARKKCAKRNERTNDRSNESRSEDSPNLGEEELAIASGSKDVGNALLRGTISQPMLHLAQLNNGNGSIHERD